VIKKIAYSILILISSTACAPAIELQEKIDNSLRRQKESFIKMIDLQIATWNKNTKTKKMHPYQRIIYENSIHILDPLFFFTKKEDLLFIFSSKNNDLKITNLQVQWDDLNSFYCNAKYDEKKWIIDFSKIIEKKRLHPSHQYTLYLSFFFNQQSQKVILVFQAQYT
jgi:hypothetical protein